MEVDLNEEKWVALFRDGVDTALSHFFKLYYKPLCYFVNRIIQNNVQVEDIVADCFVKAWERRKDFESASNIKAFLYISSKNASLNYIKRNKVKSEIHEKYSREIELGEEIILANIIESEVLGLLAKEIDNLPENYRKVFKYLYFNYLKTDEIAVEMGISVQSVRNYKARAIELLKVSLLKQGISDVMMISFLLII